MSKVLSELLGASEPKFTNVIKQLERQSGHPSVDIRLVSEIARKVADKLKELGLDQHDTNGRELYSSLQLLTQKHDEFLAKAIGVDNPDDVDEVLLKIVKQLEKMPLIKSCWAIKHSSIKRLLKNHQPKKTMKLLGYRSIDSMLKRENIDELFTAVKFIESPSWQDRLIAGYKKLSVGDFETRQVSIQIMSGRRWTVLAEDFVLNNRQNIVCSFEAGTIVLLPLPVDQMPGLCITLLPLLIYHVNEIRAYSALLKFQQVKSTFQQTLVAIASSNPIIAAEIAGQPVDWRMVFKRLDRTAANADFIEPNVEIEDLAWQSAEDFIYKLEPALKFWQGLDYTLALSQGEVVSLGLLDNAISYCNGLDYNKRSLVNCRFALKIEMMSRYLDQKQVEEQFLNQLDSTDSEFEPGLFAAGLRGRA